MASAIRFQARSAAASAGARSCRSACSLPSRSMVATSARRPQLLTSSKSLVFSPRRSDFNRRVVCNGLFGLGLPEIAVIAGIAALVFGPSKLPELGRGLGQTVKSFQTAAKEFETELKTAALSDEEKEAAAKTVAEEDKTPKPPPSV